MANDAEAAIPALSVVVVVFAGGSVVLRCLEALNRQTGSAAVEVIVAAHEAVDARAIQAVTPRARLVRGPPGAHPAHLRALGVARAKAPIVACTEDHCIPTPDWCACILTAHEGPALAIGGSIQKFEPDSAIAWAAYLLEYGRFMPPLVSGPAHYVSDCNVSYKRSALGAIADAWHGAFHETAVHAALRARGGPAAVVLDPSVAVLQSRHPAALRFFAERFEHGCLFARLRAGTFATTRRLAYAAASLGLSPLLVLRAFARAWRQPHARVAAVRALPYLVVAATCWSAGEGVGALTAARKR